MVNFCLFKFGNVAEDAVPFMEDTEEVQGTIVNEQYRDVAKPALAPKPKDSHPETRLK